MSGSYDPRNLSRLYVLTSNKSYQAVPYADVRRPPITLAELRFAHAELLREAKGSIMKNGFSRCMRGKTPSSLTPRKPPRRRGVARSPDSSDRLRRPMRSAPSILTRTRRRWRVSSGSPSHDTGSITPHRPDPRAGLPGCQSPHPPGPDRTLGRTSPRRCRRRRIGEAVQLSDVCPHALHAPLRRQRHRKVDDIGEDGTSASKFLRPALWHHQAPGSHRPNAVEPKSETILYPGTPSPRSTLRCPRRARHVGGSSH